MKAADLKDIADAIRQLANAVTIHDAVAGEDATGGSISSLTEAVMGITGGLVKVANSLEMVAGDLSGIEDALNNIARAIETTKGGAQ
jgi:hypothetical protein